LDDDQRAADPTVFLIDGSGKPKCFPRGVDVAVDITERNDSRISGLTADVGAEKRGQRKEPESEQGTHACSFFDREIDSTQRFPP
jgi:hypothetical protein